MRSPCPRVVFLHWFVSTLVIVLPPPGRIYNFLVDVGGYPVGIISVAVSTGLLYLHYTPGERWSPPYRAPRFAIILFAVGNCLLLILPWVPPLDGKGEDVGFIWYAYPATALAVLASGAIWWMWWVRFGNGSPTRQKRCLYAQVGAAQGSGWHSSGRSSGESSNPSREENGGQDEDGTSSTVVEMRQRGPCGCPIVMETSS